MNKLVGILPAAGRGSRLGVIPCSKEIMPLGFHPDSSYHPKHWHPVTTIELHLQAFKGAGVDQTAIIIGGSKFDIVEYLGNGYRYGLSIAYFYQEQLRGMPFAIDIPSDWFQDATVLFSMPDTLITPSSVMADLVEHHYARQSDITLGIFSTLTPQKFGMVDFDESDRIIDFVDKPTKTHLKYMWGCAAWSPRFSYFMTDYLSKIPQESPECVLSDIFLAALHDGLNIQAFISEGSQYHDIGTPQSFQSAVYEMAFQQKQKSLEAH